MAGEGRVTRPVLEAAATLGVLLGLLAGCLICLAVVS